MCISHQQVMLSEGLGCGVLDLIVCLFIFNRNTLQLLKKVLVNQVEI